MQPAIAQTNPMASKLAAIENVQAEHDAIDNAAMTRMPPHTMHPDAQWYGDAGLGLFIHWGIASVKGINISWSMIDGLDGKPAQIRRTITSRSRKILIPPITIPISG